VSGAPVGLTVYGCEPDEAEMFVGLAPRFGVTPTITDATASERSVVPVPGNRCISVSHRSRISGPTLRALRDVGVRHVSTRSIGFDHIDLGAARELGIAVENVVYSPDGVADYTVMLMLMALRGAKATISSAQRGDFRLAAVRGRELRDMTVGVVGAGHIGSAVIERLHGFGCHVLACTDGGRTEVAADLVPCDELLRRSDIVTLHLPLTARTHHFIGPRQIEAMKQGALLVNTARGDLVDTDALIAALEGGRLGGAALDVLEGEEGIFYFDCPRRAMDDRSLPRLQTMPNVIVTPHSAYYTERALRETVEGTLASCLGFESRCGDE
jgi:D-specific alpha-keto acid dehydrogenase